MWAMPLNNNTLLKRTGFIDTKCLNEGDYTLGHKENGQYFADVCFKCIFVNENKSILTQISSKFDVKQSSIIGLGVDFVPNSWQADTFNTDTVN